MANPHRGEVALRIGDADYTLRFSVNALCALEDALDKSAGEIVASLGDGSKVRLKTIRALVWAALLDRHPDMTMQAAGNIVSDGGTAFVMGKITEAMQAAFPAPEAKSDEARPT